MPNGKFNRSDIEQSRFFEEQLFEAKQALFFVRTVKEMKFLQTKINYLKQRMKELNGR